MSTTAQRQNSSEKMETLGEWDHSMVGDDPLRSPSPAAAKANMGIREAVVAAEHKVEGAIRGIMEEKEKAAKKQDEVTMVEALGEWDHGVCDPELKDAPEGANLRELVHTVERKADITVRKMIQKGAQAVALDDRTKQGVSGHSEEEVAGMKLCVSNVVHKDSFEAP